MTADSSARNVFRKNGVAGLGNNGHGRNLITTANPSGGSSASLLQKQLSFKTPVGSKQMGKSDEIEMIDSSNIENFNTRYNKVSREEIEKPFYLWPLKEGLFLGCFRESVQIKYYYN